MTKTSSASSNDKETATKAKPTSAKGSSTRKSSTEIILSVLATLYQRGNKSPEKKKVESLCKLNSNKTFLNSITQLKKTGMIVADGEAFCLTDKAIASLGDEMISGGGTNEEVHGRILANLKGKKAALFKILADGKAHDKEDVAQELGFVKEGKKQKGFQNLIGEMKKKEGLVEYPSPDTVQLNKEVCFPWDT
jgi:hypothetical protein